MLCKLKHIVISLFLLVGFANAQISKIDSLTILFKNAKHDTTRGNIYIALSDEYFLSNPDTIIPISNLTIALANKHKNEKNKRLLNKYLTYKAEAFNNIGGINAQSGDMKTALIFLNKSLKIREQIGDQEKIAQSLNNLGGLYDYLGEVDKALMTFQKSLRIQKKKNNKEGIAMVMNNIAGIYQGRGDILRALNYYLKCLKIQEEIGDNKGKATILNNIGNVYYNQCDYKNSMDFYTKSLEAYKKLENKRGVAFVLENIANIYIKQGEIPKATLFLNRSLEMRELIDDKGGIASCLLHLGSILKNKGEIFKALSYFERSLKIHREIQNKNGICAAQGHIAGIYFIQNKIGLARLYIDSSFTSSKELGYIDNIQTAEFILSKIDSASQNFKDAYNHFKQYIVLRDSANNEETRKSTTRNQLKYEFEKKEAVIKEQQNKEREIAQEKNKFQQIIIWSVIAGLLFVIVFAVFIFRSLKTTHRQKIIIEEKQREIIDSIHYAKRIQQSLLTSEKYIDIQLKKLKGLSDD